jgi:hypothetical protein
VGSTRTGTGSTRWRTIWTARRLGYCLRARSVVSRVAETVLEQIVRQYLQTVTQEAGESDTHYHQRRVRAYWQAVHRIHLLLETP